ncbi:hypothetical protein GGX14DRAFT_384130 [Mycena pura]|uniref:Uncharacterized protein n=1 Tax=Mycena pura TaxID=153505 RepID=A0AAD6YUR7_9AGAR|nr:hypothetical protein GGX14DRAFT_384130 [Mycena pura]
MRRDAQDSGGSGTKVGNAAGLARWTATAVTIATMMESFHQQIQHLGGVQLASAPHLHLLLLLFGDHSYSGLEWSMESSAPPYVSRGCRLTHGSSVLAVLYSVAVAVSAIQIATPGRVEANSPLSVTWTLGEGDPTTFTLFVKNVDHAKAHQAHVADARDASVNELLQASNPQKINVNPSTKQPLRVDGPFKPGNSRIFAIHPTTKQAFGMSKPFVVKPDQGPDPLAALGTASSASSASLPSPPPASPSAQSDGSHQGDVGTNAPAPAPSTAPAAAPKPSPYVVAAATVGAALLLLLLAGGAWALRRRRRGLGRRTTFHRSRMVRAAAQAPGPAAGGDAELGGGGGGGGGGGDARGEMVVATVARLGYTLFALLCFAASPAVTQRRPSEPVGDWLGAARGSVNDAHASAHVDSSACDIIGQSS